jgi:hypothetical protein
MFAEAMSNWSRGKSEKTATPSTLPPKTDDKAAREETSKGFRRRGGASGERVSIKKVRSLHVLLPSRRTDIIQEKEIVSAGSSKPSPSTKMAKLKNMTIAAVLFLPHGLVRPFVPAR